MEGGFVSQRASVLVLAAAVASLIAGAAQARPIPPAPTVELGSVGRLAPDGRSMDVDLRASCPARWTVTQATVSVSQGSASGQAPFTLPCTGGLQLLTVNVQANGAPFQLADAQATAFLRIERGRTLQAQDSGTLRVFPNVVVRLADTADPVDGGASVRIDVTVSCAAGPTPQQSSVTLTQGPTTGRGMFVPTCDGQPNTFSVSVPATQGRFVNDFAWGNAFVTVDHEGDLVFGEDNRLVLIGGGCC